MTTMNTQLGVVDESTYGTPVTVTRFFEFNSFDFDGDYGRVESKGMRPSGRTQRSDRWEPYANGATATLGLDIPTKGFGFFLKHMQGAVGTAGPTDSNYVHTGTEGSLTGDFFTTQVNVPLHPAGTNQALTLHGCKISDWEIGCDAEGVLVGSLELDAEDYDTSTGLASASYPSDYRVFSWAGGALTIDAASVEVSNFKVSCSNELDVDRRYLRANPLKKEPIENGMRTYEWSCTADFVDLTQFNRVRSATRLGALGAIVATFDGPVVHAGATLPRFTVTIPAARFDTGTPSISGPEGIQLDLSGVATWDGTNSPVSLAYRTSDVTP